jgi:hypothetical protein
MPTPDFTLECFQNEYLPDGAEEVNAVVTVTATTGGGVGDRPSGAGAGAVEVITVDVSGSMGGGGKIQAARKATAAAIDAIRDGVRFAVVAGDSTARIVYPAIAGSRSPTLLAVASPQTRAEARDAVGALQAAGGTAIGAWLTCIAGLVRNESGIRHAILLTDGRDESETPWAFQQAIDGVKGVFQCDCRGVGTDWSVAELRRVSDALLGTVDIVADPSRLAADFESMMAAAMGKSVADVSLRLWTPQGAAVKFVRMVSPEMRDLTGRRTDVNPLTGDYPTGAWGDESRDHHVCVTVKPGSVGDEMLAARVSLVVDGQVVRNAQDAPCQALVRAIWTDDAALSTRINRQIAHYTGQAEMADAIAEGLEARKRGDTDTATVKLGRAVQLAAQAGNSDTVRLLSRVVDVDDVDTGTVRLKPAVAAADEMTLDTQSTKTVRVSH